MNYYAVLPSNVRYNKKLSPSVKLFYAELTAFADQEARVDYDPKHFEAFFKVTNRTIRRWVESLREEQLIYVEKKQLFLTTGGATTYDQAKYFTSEPPNTIKEDWIDRMSPGNG